MKATHIDELKSARATSLKCLHRAERRLESARKACESARNTYTPLDSEYRQLTSNALPGVKTILHQLDEVRDRMGSAISIYALMIDPACNLSRVTLRHVVTYTQETVEFVPALRNLIISLSDGLAASTRFKRAATSYLHVLDQLDTCFAAASKRQRRLEVKALATAVDIMWEGLTSLRVLASREVLSVGHASIKRRFIAAALLADTRVLLECQGPGTAKSLFVDFSAGSLSSIQMTAYIKPQDIIGVAAIVQQSREANAKQFD